MEIPKSLKKYEYMIADIDLMEPDEECKYDIMLKRGYSFDYDPMWCGQNGYKCQTIEHFANVREALGALRRVRKCDCAACLRKDPGGCQV